MPERSSGPYFSTGLGSIIHSDSLGVLRAMDADSVDLVMTSPPFALLKKKEYGNADAPDYIDWFMPFAEQIMRVLRPSGSFVFELGGAWNKGSPTRNLYHFRLMLALCDEIGFRLAHEHYWWNPSRLPSPAEWVTVRKVRVKDAVSIMWWLSKTDWPKAGNRRVTQPYSASMLRRIEEGEREGERPRLRPSGHSVTANFGHDNGGAIGPNLLAIPHTESNSSYLRHCKENGITPHPARFPALLPAYFVRFLTDRGDLVVDPFAGSCTTGAVCERLGRRWLCAELDESYLRGAVGRFSSGSADAEPKPASGGYTLPHLGRLLDNTSPEDLLPSNGGRTRPPKIDRPAAEPHRQRQSNADPDVVQVPML